MAIFGYFDPADRLWRLCFRWAKSTKLATALDAVFSRIPRPDLEWALEVIGNSARQPDDHYYERVPNGYPYIQKFLPLLVSTVHFEGTASGERILKALAALPKLKGRRRVTSIEERLPHLRA